MVWMISRRGFIRMRAGGACKSNPSSSMFKKKKSKHGMRSLQPNEKNTCSTEEQGCYTTSSSNDDNDWLVFEILNRVPVKSLARFKTVCKRWCYIIQKDQHFMDLHLTRFKPRFPSRLFMVVPPYDEDDKYFKCKELYITADFLFEEEDNTKLKLVVDKVTEVDSSSYYEVLKPVNGLICQIEAVEKDVARVCSISTGQVSPWFHVSSILVGEERVSSMLVGEELVKHQNLYAFGFDPATNEYKLVCVLTVQSDNNTFEYFVCGVLTIGRQCNNNRWRRIAEVPPISLTDDHVYVNGVIYWFNRSLDRWAWNNGYRPVYLVAFDVGNEKFRTITIPDFILDAPRFVGKLLSFDSIAQLFEVDGNLAMTLELNRLNMFTMYVYEDGDYNDKDEKLNGTSTSSSLKIGRWREVSLITLPFVLETCQTVMFHTFTGSDDKILVTCIQLLENEPSCEKVKRLSIYCYNWKKITWTKVDVSGISSLIQSRRPSSFSTTFSENLMSLNNHSAL